jgi:hypothetical protein
MNKKRVRANRISLLVVRKVKSRAHLSYFSVALRKTSWIRGAEELLKTIQPRGIDSGIYRAKQVPYMSTSVSTGQ